MQLHNTNTPSEATGLDPASVALTWLQQHEQGVILRQLGEELIKASIAVETHPGAKSQACLTLKIGLRRIENKQLVEVGHELTTKLPKPPVSTGIFWTDGTGRLHANNPKQRELGFPREDRPAAQFPIQPASVGLGS